MQSGPYRRSAAPPGPPSAASGDREHPAFIALAACAGLAALGADLAGAGPLGVASVAGCAMLAFALRAACAR